MSDLIAHLTPALPVILAGLLAAATPWYGARKAITLAGPLLAAAMWFAVAAPGTYGVIEVAGHSLETFRFDATSRLWGLVFIIAAFLNSLYGLHGRSRLQDAAALIYAGAGVGAVFAGDLLTLFFFWELTALASVFLIWASATPSAYRAGLRYLVIQVLSGVLLLTGAVIHADAAGSWRFDAIGLNSPGGAVILIAFAIKAAFPLVHNWMTESYPKATPFGAVVLSAFTTKLAVYALARGFAGEDILIQIGVVMALFPVFFALVADDLRKTLAYSLMSQLGVMVAAIGLGGQMAIGGAAAMAAASVLYKGLLFMAMGAVLTQAGTAQASRLGGLWRAMPLTALFTLAGSATIMAVPLTVGFAGKALALTAFAREGMDFVWLALMAASAAAVLHTGIKIPYMAFFAPPREGGVDVSKVKEAPAGMLMAMGLAAFLCVYLGINYGALYDLLPYRATYDPFSYGHVISQLQVIAAVLAAFALLARLGLYPRPRPGEILDVDWLYRRLGYGVARWGWLMTDRLWASMDNVVMRLGKRAAARLHETFSPIGTLSRDIPSGALTIWTGALLALVLIVAYFAS